jgi:hypothetical protein
MDNEQIVYKSEEFVSFEPQFSKERLIKSKTYNSLLEFVLDGNPLIYYLVGLNNALRV